MVESPFATVAAVRCPGAGHGWSAEEQVSGTAVVLVRRGVFRRRVDGRSSLVDVTLGYRQLPGEMQQVAHPAGGDVCTSIGLPGELAERFAGLVRVPPAADLAHRRLLAAPAVPTDRADLAAELIAALLPGASASPTRPVAPAVDEVRFLLHGDASRDLATLAATVGWSPWHLSRTFHRATGVTLSRYRRRLRVRAALDEITSVARPRLAEIAVRAGFADQAHMTRAIRAETGAGGTRQFARMVHVGLVRVSGSGVRVAR